MSGWVNDVVDWKDGRMFGSVSGWVGDMLNRMDGWMADCVDGWMTTG